MVDTTYNSKVYEKQGGDEVVVASGGKITEDPGGAILGRAVLNTVFADVGSAGSVFVTTPFAGTIVRLDAVNHIANAGTATTLLAKLGGTNVTAPSWQIAVTAAAGTNSSVVPTAANVVAAGDVIEIASDGASSAVEPTTISVTILRTS